MCLLFFFLRRSRHTSGAVVPGVQRCALPILMRSALAFGASVFFTIEAACDAWEVKQADTSDAGKHLPLYTYASVPELALPRGCALVGVELTEEAIELPSFYHPQAAAYVLGQIGRAHV